MAAVADQRCCGIVIHGSPFGSRMVTGCHQPVVEVIDGKGYCTQHAREHHYREVEFERMMATATRHSPGVRFGFKGSPGAGTHCSCGVFVHDGVEHPFGLAAQLEDLLEGPPG